MSKTEKPLPRFVAFFGGAGGGFALATEKAESIQATLALSREVPPERGPDPADIKRRAEAAMREVGISPA